jgi:hypothetical protein
MTTPLLPTPTAPGGSRGESRRRVVLVAATVATMAVCVVALAGLIDVALLSARGQRWDLEAMNSLGGSSATVMTLLSGLGTVSIGTAAAGLALCVVMALSRQRISHALGAVVIVGGANVTTQLLKRVLLERPDLDVGYVWTTACRAVTRPSSSRWWPPRCLSHRTARALRLRPPELSP